MIAFSLIYISLISSAAIAKKFKVPERSLGYKQERLIQMNESWTEYLPNIDEMDNITPYLLEFIQDPRVNQTITGDCDRLGKTGKEFHNLRCFLNIIRRCRISEAQCEYNLRGQGDAKNKNSVAFKLLAFFALSERKKDAEAFLDQLANSTFKELPSNEDIVFSLAIMYVRFRNGHNTRARIGRLHLALRRVSYITDSQFKRLYNNVVPQKNSLVIKRAETSGSGPLTNFMLSLCSLSSVIRDQTILAGCLAGVGSYCQDRTKRADCQKYYETVYGNSIYASVGSTCPNWKSGTNSRACSDAVNGICNDRKYGPKSGECNFAKFSKGYIFTNATLAPWQWRADELIPKKMMTGYLSLISLKLIRSFQ